MHRDEEQQGSCLAWVCKAGVCLVRLQSLCSREMLELHHVEGADGVGTDLQGLLTQRLRE